jgi:hypothetical protein
MGRVAQEGGTGAGEDAQEGDVRPPEQLLAAMDGHMRALLPPSPTPESAHTLEPGDRSRWHAVDTVLLSGFGMPPPRKQTQGGSKIGS